MIKKIISGVVLGLGIVLLIVNKSYADQTIIVSKVAQEPAIDGVANDKAWGQAKAITTHDKVADIDILIKGVYIDKKIFFLVTYPDKDKSSEHRMWTWNKQKEEYEAGGEREDVFVFKWNLEKTPVDLSIFADTPYAADLWFWKACRTDPAGYADDKIQFLGLLSRDKSKEILSKSEKKMYLQRSGDKGKSSYKSKIRLDYQGDKICRYKMREPTDSRADIKAKGVWKDGQWTIEFGRALNTGSSDDIQFDLKQSYQFGISRYEVAGREKEPESGQPLYGCGDISENLTLKFNH
jgi:hypothetical protein